MCDAMEVTIESDAPDISTFEDGTNTTRLCPARFEMIANAMDLVPEQIAEAMQNRQSAAVLLNLEEPTVWVPRPGSPGDLWLKTSGHTYRLHTKIHRPMPDPEQVEVPDVVPEWLTNPDQLPPF